MRLFHCLLLFFSQPRSKHEVKLLNSAKRAVFPLFFAASVLVFPFDRKKRGFGATLDAVLTFMRASESRGDCCKDGSSPELRWCWRELCVGLSETRFSEPGAPAELLGLH